MILRSIYATLADESVADLTLEAFSYRSVFVFSLFLS